MASTTTARVRRKPAPKLDIADDAALLVAANSEHGSEHDVRNERKQKRASFTLYPDPLPLSSSPSSSPSASTGGHGHPHYTRRALSSSPSPTPSSASATSTATTTCAPATTAPPARRALARLQLLLPHASPPRVRKHTISSPAPVAVPAEMVPPALAAFMLERDKEREKNKRELGLPPPLTVSDRSTSWLGVSPTSASASSRSCSSSSAASGETGWTSPPISPLSFGGMSPCYPLSPLSLSSPLGEVPSLSSPLFPAATSPASLGTTPAVDVLLKRRPSGTGKIIKRRPSVSAGTYAYAPFGAPSTSTSMCTSTSTSTSTFTPLDPRGPAPRPAGTPRSVSSPAFPSARPRSAFIPTSTLSSHPGLSSFPAPPFSPPFSTTTCPTTAPPLSSMAPNNANPKTKPHPLPALTRPTPAALLRAARLPLVAPSGVRVAFGEVLGMPLGAGDEIGREDVDLGATASPAHADPNTNANRNNANTNNANPSPARRTLVIFLRHFWCPLCQDYMVALARGVNAAVDGAGGGGFAAAASGSTATSASSTPVPNSVSLPTTCSARVSPSTSMGMAIPASLSAIFEPPAGSAPNARASFSPSYAFPPSSAAPSSSAVPDTEHADADADTDTEDADADADDTPPCAACAARSEGDAYLGGLGVISSAGAGAGAGASPKDADAAGEWAARACGGFVCDVGVGVGVDVDGVHVDAEVDDLRSFGGQEPDQQGEGQEPEEHRNGASPAGGEGEGEGGEGTHILLIAPGAHTLAERYLASFGFPAVPSYSSEEGGGGPRFELGDPLVRASTSDGVADGAGGANVKDEGEKEKGEEKARDGEDGEKETEKGGNREKRPRNPIASIRLFVDPRPAEGVYAALGMGWAAARPGASPAPSPAASPVIPGAGAGVGGPGMSRTVSSPGVGIRFGVAGGGGGVLPRSTSLGMAASTAQDPPTSPPSAQGTTDPLSQVQDPHASPASYVTHGVLSGIGAVVMRALRAGMPVWERGGDVRLLGGEFVFEWGPTRTPGTATSPTDAGPPTLRCTYAHRMQTTRGHASVARVLAAAGVHVPPPLSQPGSLSDDPHQTSRDARRVSGSFGRASLPRAVSTSVIPRAVSTSVLPRAAASSVIVTASASTDSSEREHERERAVVPRSASTPPASGMFFLGSGRSRNIFQRFAGPRGARERRGREEREREQGRAQDGGKEKVKDDAIKPRDAPSIRERPSIPRSASTPPGKAGALWGQHHGWAHVPRWGAGTDVGVIWEGDDAGVDEEADNADESGRDREPVMRATLSASSSRPWALVASGSSASLVSEVSEFVAKEGTGQVSNREPSTSGSSVALSMSLRSNNVSASSASTSELEETFPSPYHPYLAGQHAPRVYVAEEEGTEGDDERSGSEETSRRVYPFPRAGVPHARPKSEYTPAPAAAVAPVQPRPVSALVRAKWTYGRGHSRARSEQSSYASHGRAEDGEEGEEGEYAYARGYGGDGYGSSVDGEDVWMRARAQSLARLKARKEVRRGGG